MQPLYIDPVLQTYFFNHKAVSASLIQSHFVVFLCIYQVLDKNPMGHFLFNLMAKKVSIFKRQIYITTFPFAMWRYICSNIFSFLQYSRFIKNVCYLSLHYLNMCKTASQPNTVAFIPVVQQAAQPSYAISKLNTIMGQTQLF